MRKPGLLFGYWNCWSDENEDKTFTFIGFDLHHHNESVMLDVGFLGFGLHLGFDYHQDKNLTE